MSNIAETYARAIRALGTATQTDNWAFHEIARQIDHDGEALPLPASDRLAGGVA